jgi:predicted deacetylase
LWAKQIHSGKIHLKFNRPAVMSGNLTDVSSIYDFTVKDLHDKEFKLSKYDNNQVLLIVNFATNDELADKNFLELKELKQRYCDGENRFKRN